jgi:hypothetical protein
MTRVMHAVLVGYALVSPAIAATTGAGSTATPSVVDGIIVIVDCSDGPGESPQTSRRRWLLSHLFDAIPDEFPVSVILYGHADPESGLVIEDYASNALRPGSWNFKCGARLAIADAQPTRSVVYLAGACDVARAVVESSHLNRCAVVIVTHAKHQGPSDRTAIQNLRRTSKTGPMCVVAVPIDTDVKELERFRNDVEGEDAVFRLARTNAEVTSALTEVTTPLDEARIFRSSVKHSLEQRVTELTGEASRREDLIKGQVAEIAGLRTENAQNKAQVASLKDNLDTVTLAINDINKSAEREKSSDEATIQRLRADLVATHQVVAQRDAEIAGLEAVTHTQSRSLTEFSATAASQAEKLNQLQATLEACKCDALKQIECLQETIGGLQCQLRECQDQNESKALRICELTTQKSVVEAQLALMTTDRDNWRRAHEACKCESEKKIACLHASIAEIQCELDSCQQVCLQKEHELGNVNSRLRSIKATLDQAETARDAAQARVTLLEPLAADGQAQKSLAEERLIRITQLTGEVNALNVLLASKPAAGPMIVSNEKNSNDKISPSSGGGGAAASSSSSAASTGSSSGGTMGGGPGSPQSSGGDSGGGFGDFLSTVAPIVGAVLLGI